MPANSLLPHPSAMRTLIRRLASRLPAWSRDLLVGLVADAASGMVPALLITSYALAARDSARITTFAMSVAEPSSLAGAIAVVALFPSSGGRRGGLRRGLVAAAVMVASAWWVHDVDGWTAAAVGLLPVAAMIAARVRRPSRPALEPAAARPPLAGEPFSRNEAFAAQARAAERAARD